MLKYKVAYGKQYDYDFDSPLDEQIVLTTPDNVCPEDILCMVSNIYDLVSAMVFIWNEEHQHYERADLLDINWRPIQMKDIVKTHKVLKSYRLKNND